MTEKFVFVEHLSNLNDIIKQPLQLTQRIKFTSFDVSNNYLLFGASSGGIYVFWRHPCQFLKLIPNKEGSIVQLSISPDERTAAFATSKGLVMLLQGCFGDGEPNCQQFCEHEGNLVTALKWQGSEVYCGDNTGKISVVTLSNLLTKAIFQTPSASLMTLDSSIVQIDSYSKFLLISTQTRTYLCDTKKENYRQIGKKLRDGTFGACFISSGNDKKEATSKSPATKSFLQVIGDDEAEETDACRCVKIFCARPGSRLWKVDFDASVTCTYQFKNSLVQRPANIIHLDSNADARLSLTDFSVSPYSVPDGFNFGKLLILAKKFIFTFGSDGFYIFHPETVSLLFWSNYFGNIIDVKTANNFIYLRTDDFHLHVASVAVLEELVLETLFRKQYFFCAELCLHFSEDVLALMKVSNRIHLVAILKEKLAELDCQYLVEQIGPLLEKLQEFSDNKNISQKLKSGIFVVDNAHFVQNALENKEEESQHSAKDGSTVVDKLTESGRNIKEKLQFLEVAVKKFAADDVSKQKSKELVTETKESQVYDMGTESDPSNDVYYNINTLYKQFELNKINRNIETQKLKDLLAAKDVVSIMELLQKFSEHMKDFRDEQEIVDRWISLVFLKFLSKEQTENVFDMDPQSVTFACEAFIKVNSSSGLSCKCSYPLPMAKQKIPQFYQIGCEICRRSVADITTHVPYMWKYVLTNIRNNEEIANLLLLIVQFNDEEIFKQFMDRFSYDTWDEAAKLLIKLKKGNCINCDAKIDIQGCLSWTDFGLLMVQSLGGISTVKLLKRYSSCIPNEELDKNFYQTCIFSTTMDNLQHGFRKEAVNFVKDILSEENMAQQFNDVMVKYLHRKHLKKVFFDTAGQYSMQEQERCTFCDLPLKIEILEDVSKLQCGHVFHKICLDYNKGTCCSCKTVM